MLKGVSTNRRVFNARFTKASEVFLTVVLKWFLVHKVTKRFMKFSEKGLPFSYPHNHLPKQTVGQLLSADFVLKITLAIDREFENCA